MATNQVQSVPGLNALRRYVGTMFRKGEMAPGSKQKGKSQPALWFDIPPTGPVILYSPKAEMGQGIYTALAQIACEDLMLLPHQIKVIPTPTVKEGVGRARTRDFGSMSDTAGSTSVKSVYYPLRLSSSALLEMLLVEGARQLGVERSKIVASEGTVYVSGEANRTRTYGEIVAQRGGALSAWPLPKPLPPMKPASQFQVIGKEFPRVDAVEKVRGKAKYGYDAVLPGTLFGAVAHPPRYGAKLRSADTAAASAMPGVLKVVVESSHNFVGVVATTRTKAWAALGQIEAVWAGGTTFGDVEIERELSKPGGAVLIDRGNVTRELSGKSGVVTAEYSTSAVAHAHLEPIGALANVTAEGAEVWVPTQRPSNVAVAVRKAIGAKRVVVNPTYLGSGFGRKFMIHAATDAARLSKAVGKPVHVGWSSEQDLRHGPFRPPTITRFEGVVANGRMRCVDQFNATGNVIEFPKAAEKLLAFHPGAQNGLELPYEIPNYRLSARLADLPIPTGIWRGVGLLPNIFAAECFVDELAHHAGVDPLQFRLDHLADDSIGTNLRRLLTEVATRADWSEPLPAGDGRGVACCGMSGSLISAVAEVSVVARDIQVRRVVVCVDPGLVINPAGAKLQIIGGIMMGISSALYERITFSKGMADQHSFDDYHLLKPNQAPPIDVHLMGTGDIPAGLGEPGVGPVAAAIGNAVFNATGIRVRSLPIELP